MEITIKNVLFIGGVAIAVLFLVLVGSPAYADTCTQRLATFTERLEVFATEYPGCMIALAEDDLRIALRGGQTMIKYDAEILTLATFPIKWEYEKEKANECEKTFMSFFPKNKPGVKCHLDKEVNAVYDKIMGPAAAKVREKVYQQVATFKSESGYQNVKWGMSLMEVGQKVDGLQQNRQGVWFKSERIADINMGVGYAFINNKLFMVVLISAEQPGVSSRYVEEFNHLKNILTQRYGKPIKYEEKWDSDFRKNMLGGLDLMPEQIRIGHVHLIAKWQDGQTTIELKCGSRNFEITNSVVYTSTELEKWSAFKNLKAQAADL